MSTERRFFSRAELCVGAEIELDEAATRHARVLRLELGDELTLFDGKGGDALARVTHLDAQGLRVVVQSATPSATDGRPRVVLIQCMPKGSKLDEIVRGVSEVGVAEIHLAHAARSVAKPDDARAERKLERLEKIAREASRQSENTRVPELLAPASLVEVVRRAPSGAARLHLAARAPNTAWRAALAQHAEAWLVVGPEGGLSEDEESLLSSLGYAPTHLAVGILRVETAAVVASALVLDALQQRV